MTPILPDMFAHLQWADRRTLAMLRDAGDAAPEAWKLYCHILGAEHIWMMRILRRPVAPEPWPMLTPAECEALSAENGADFETILVHPDRFDLDAVVEYRNLAGVGFRTALSDILVHVALHGVYHRGQVAKLLRQAACAVVPTDYILFCRETKPL